MENKLHFTRRKMLIAGTGLAAVGMAADLLPGSKLLAAHAADSGVDQSEAWNSLPVKEIEGIMQASGRVENGVLDISIAREDLDNVTLHIRGYGAVPFKPSWQNNGDFYFQSLGSGRAIMNADFGGLLPSEIDPFIDKLLEGGLVFQAFHQHFYNLSPQLYFIHFRGIGDPLKLARAAHAAVKVTRTPLPQPAPSHPTTTLPAQKMANILDGSATIGDNGVVMIDVPRREQIRLAGVPINPNLNVATTIAFEPLGNGLVAAAPDFAMITSEVQNVTRVMRQQGWDIGCLYNQETGELPQLYFSHQAKVGDPVTLAREIRNGLNQTNSEGS